MQRTYWYPEPPMRPTRPHTPKPSLPQPVIKAAPVPPRVSKTERFWAKAAPGPQGHLLWTGKTLLVTVDEHRLSVQEAAWIYSRFEPLPLGVRIVSICGEPTCVHPEHLGTAPLPASRRTRRVAVGQRGPDRSFFIELRKPGPTCHLADGRDPSGFQGS